MFIREVMDGVGAEGVGTKFPHFGGKLRFSALVCGGSGGKGREAKKKDKKKGKKETKEK